MTALSTNNDEQMKLLEDALQVVRMHASQMRQCLDRGSLGRRHRHRAKYGLSRSGDNDDEHSDGDNDGEDDDESGVLDAIKHCSAMLGELRTSALTPKNYYELYLAVFDALQFLIGSLRDAHISGKHHLADLYELVQYAGNVVPRLYLMVTVGSALLGLTVAKRARAEQRNGDGADSNAATATSKADREDGDDDGDDVPVQEIMMDMLEMSRGVQHPTRGLFLRYYLDQMTKGSLAYADVDDAIYFTLTNFTEMNKLWVRLQHLGHSREREKRELERRELRTLVGSNLIRLASLERITLDHYKGKVLPHLLKQVVSCKDPLAQEYLMEAIVQAFSDEWHIATLSDLVDVLGKLHPKVTIKGIVVALFNRIQAYLAKVSQVPAESGEDAARAARPSDKELFDTLWEHMQALVSVRADLPTSDMVAILGSMLRLSFSGVERGPEALNTVNLVIAFTRVQLERRTTFPDIGAASTTNQILSFLLSPLRVYQNPLQILDLKDYQRLLGSQSDYIQKSVSTAIVTAMLQRETIMSTVEQVKGVLLLCTKLIAGVSVTRPDMSSHKGSSSSSARGSSVSRTPVVDEVEIAEEQGLLARLVHQIRCEEPETQALALVAARNAFLGGRVEYTFPSIVTAAINIVHQYGETKPVASATDSQHDGAADNGEAAGESNGEEKQAEEDDDGGGAAQAKADAKAVTQIEEDIGEWRRKVQHLLRFIQMSIDKIPEEVTALRLSIMAAQAVASEQAFAGEVEIEEAAYELFVQAFTVYEERVSDSRVQYDVLMQLLGAVHTSRNFSKDNFETLAEKCAVYGKKLLKRPDQARAAYACAYLWWRGDSTTDNSDNVFEQLLRSHKIAEAVFDPAVRLQLLIELLNRAVILYERECSSVTPKYLTDMIQLIRSSLEAEDVFDDSEATKVRRLGAASNVSDSSPADPSSLWTPADESPREWIPRFFAETLEYIESGEFPGVRTNPL